jgi:hypothetical protein
MTDERLPITQDLFVTPEYRIQRHAIARLRLGQPIPDYRVNDVDFDAIVARTRIRIDRSAAGEVVARMDFGTTTARILAGGGEPADGHVELVEP